MELLLKDRALIKKLEGLKDIIMGLESVVVAFSGGVDSSLITKVCYDALGDKAMAVTANSETYPGFELEEAKTLAKAIRIKHLVIETSELAIEGFADNPPNRCYFCKTELFEKLKEIASQHGFKHVADGANLDDTGDFRPGLEAAKELGIRSPLKEARLTKDDVRQLSKLLGLSTWDKPSYACMSSRFPYGEKITKDKLTMVSRAEELLRAMGFKQFRVRHHDTIARIEVPSENIRTLTDPLVRTEIVKKFKEIGFTYVTIDLEGFRSGSMNETLKPLNS